MSLAKKVQQPARQLVKEAIVRSYGSEELATDTAYTYFVQGQGSPRRQN